MKERELGTVGQAILDALRPDKKLVTAEIVDIVKAPISNVSGTLSNMFKNGRVDREPTITKNGRTTYAYSIAATKLRRKYHRKVNSKVGVLITIQYGKKESVTLSHAEAKQIFEHLSDFFSK